MKVGEYNSKIDITSQRMTEFEQWVVDRGGSIKTRATEGEFGNITWEYESAATRGWFECWNAAWDRAYTLGWDRATTRQQEAFVNQLQELKERYG